MKQPKLRQPNEVKVGDYTLEEILERHKHWLNNDIEGWYDMRANLSHADLSWVDLEDVDLRYANLCSTNLQNADLRDAKFCNSNLFDSNLSHAQLQYADLRRARLGDSDLRNADLRNAELHYCDLNRAIIDESTKIVVPMACPSEGSFIGWKKVLDYITSRSVIVKLQIPASAKRSSSTSNKCRCSKAKVLKILNIDGTKSELTEVINVNYAECKYEVGKMVYPDSFDENRWNECSNGIHFFVDREEALKY